MLEFMFRQYEHIKNAYTLNEIHIKIVLLKKSIFVMRVQSGFESSVCVRKRGKELCDSVHSNSNEWNDLSE